MIGIPLQPEESMAHKVNLDALIRRADFEITSSDEGYPAIFTLPELEARKNTFNILRKPDFQRSTSDWTPQQIVNLVKCFVDRDLIPSIIIWNSPARLQFVMDGAHRLSALIAWVNDDYGYGAISQQEYGRDNIQQAQKDAHNATRALMEEVIGSYQDLLKIDQIEGAGTDLQRKRARGMNSFPIDVQSYSKADRRKAEASFYRINQGGTALDVEEREIIRTRHWPESIAARAIWRIGKGQQYWSGFSTEIVAQIEDTAKSVQALLLKPEIEKDVSPIQLPVIGSAYLNAGIGILARFVHLANDLPERKQNTSFDPLPEIDPKADTTGETTLAYLAKSKRLAEEIASKQPFSLGLHPAIYAYSKAGKFLPGAFFAEVLFVKDLIARGQLHTFTDKRKAFEDFLVGNKHHVTALTHDGGSKMKSAPAILQYYQTVLNALIAGNDVIEALKSEKGYEALASQVDETPPAKRSSKVGGSSIAMRLREALDTAMRCYECGARIYKDTWTHDHDIPASEGGTGHSDNLHPMHPFCNSGHKERRLHLQGKTST